MKRMKLGLHIWIAVTSIFSFLGGWAVFSHSAKPAAILPGLNASAQVQGVPTLAPIPSLDSLMAASGKTQTGLQPLPSLKLSANSTALRTHGS